MDGGMDEGMSEEMDEWISGYSYKFVSSFADATGHPDLSSGTWKLENY